MAVLHSWSSSDSELMRTTTDVMEAVCTCQDLVSTDSTGAVKFESRTGDAGDGCPRC